MASETVTREDLKAILNEVLPPKDDSFRGADASRTETISVSGTTANITPSKDGWLRVSATTSSGQSIAPVLSADQNGIIVAASTGITYASSVYHVSFPVKAGLTYGIVAYRSTLSSAILFY